MTQLDTIALAVAELRARGVSRHIASPHMYRLLWWLGIAVPPPLFQGFLTVSAMLGVYIGLSVALGYGIALLLVPPDLTDPWERTFVAVVLGALAGCIFGPLVSLYYQWQARRLQLPAWNDYVPDLKGEEEAW